MMNSAYLFGIKRSKSSFSGIEIIGFGSDAWYAGSYNDVKSGKFIPIKKQIVEQTNILLKENTSADDWHWHHVVESQHIEKILGVGDSKHEREFQIPTVLIYNREHRFFSQNFSNRDFKELTFTSKYDSEIPSISAIYSKEEREGLKRRIESLQMMYNHMYTSYPTFKTIARNIFNYHLNIL